MNRSAPPARFLRDRPAIADALLAAAVTALSLLGMLVDPTTEGRALTDIRDSDALAVALVLLACLPLAFRRRAPVLTLGVTGCATTIYSVLRYPPSGVPLGVLVAFYSVAVYAERRESLASAAVTAVALFVSLLGYREDLGIAGFIANYVIFGTAWILGDNIRTRRAYTAALEDRAARAERERELEGRRAVSEERSRIARELHDVVAHSVSVMVVQAQGARRVLRTDPERADEALASVEATGRLSLTEMRRLLDVLRSSDEGAGDREPQPGVARLEALVEQVRGAGLPVDLEVEGEALALPAGVELSAYRIVQEALTNALKHGGPAARASVRLRFTPTDLVLHVSDDGRGIAAAVEEGPREGHGLVGMRERIAMLGGDLRAGPRSGGGYDVRVRIPLDGSE